MSCGAGCSGESPRPWSPEFKRPWKPENNAGCSCGGGNRNTCDGPSLARPGSPLWKWEKEHGKLVTLIAFEQDAQGHPVTRIEKVICKPEPPSRPDRHGCCSFRYRVQR